MGRNVQSRGFHVLPSYYEAIRDLPDKERFPLYDALFDYGFEGAEPENLSPVGQAIFSLIRPVMDKSVRYYEEQQRKALLQQERKRKRAAREREDEDGWMD